MEDPFIEFIHHGDENVTQIKPEPAATVKPEWFKKVPPYQDEDDPNSSTSKLCRAFTDAIDIGFIIPFHQNYSFRKHSKKGITTGNEQGVTILPPTNDSSKGNSSYSPPDAVIHTPWEFKTPEGYYTLITKPMNRESMTPGVKPHSLVIDTDTYDGTVSIPISVISSNTNITLGQPLVQVIPMKRSAAIEDFNTYSERDRPETYSRWGKENNRTTVRPGIYKDVHWVQKGITNVLIGNDASDATVNDVEIDNTKPTIPSESFVDEHKMAFTTEEMNFGVIPEPVRSNELAPPWLDTFAEQASRGDGLSRIDATLLQQWMERACSLGIIIRYHADVSLRIDSEGEISYDTPYDKKPLQFFQRGQVGNEFPLPYAFPNLLSEWISELPRGYSNLYIEPLNHHQQYFRSFTGIVDDDWFTDTTNTPGRLVTDRTEIQFNAGMPVVQMIPYHRDSMIMTGVVRSVEEVS